MCVQQRQALDLALHCWPDGSPGLSGSLVPGQALLVGMHECAALAVESLFESLTSFSDVGKERPVADGFVKHRRMRFGELNQIAAAARVKELLPWLGHQSRQLADDGVVFFPIGELQRCQRLRSDDVIACCIRFLPHASQLFRGDPRRAGDEISTEPQALEPALEVGAPASGEPTQVQRCSEAVERSLARQGFEDMTHGLLVLAQDPVSVLAHDGEPMDNDRLARAEKGPEAALVELFGQLEIGVVHRRRKYSLRPGNV